jgi:hypothetical protein
MNQQRITELTVFLTKNPGYIKKGAEWLANKLDCTVQEIRAAKENLGLKYNDKDEYFRFKEANKPVRDNIVDNTIESTNSIKEFDEYLSKLGIIPEDVKSVKYWQTQGGETRYSVVTKNDGLELPTLEDITKELVTNVLPLQLPVIPVNANDTLVVFLSDKHIGALTKPEAMYDNEYNEKVLVERLIKVVSEIYRNVHIRGTFEKIVIADLGDAMDGYNGQTTRGGHKLPQNMTNKEAFEVFIRIHKSFYNALFASGFAQSYEIYHISNDNHGGEFGHFATRCLQEYLKCSYPEVTFEILDKFITPTSISGHTYLLTHGKDEEDMKNGLPVSLDIKTENYIKDYVLDKGISTKNLHFVKGDLHQAGTQWGKHFRYRNVPSMYGSSKWIMTNFGHTKPGCSFDLISGDSIQQWELWF